MNSRHKGRETGFTLLELLVVLAIAGLLVSIVPPMYSAAVPGARFRAEVNNFATAIRAARNEAVLSAQDTRIVLDKKTMSYAVDDESPVRLTSMSGVAFSSSFGHGAGHGRTAGRVSGDSAAIEFHADGSSSGGSIRFDSDSGTYLVSVDWLTGRVRVLAQDSEKT